MSNQLINSERPQVIVPAGWNREQDLAYVEQTRGTSEEIYRTYLLDRIEDNTRNFESVLNQTIGFLLNQPPSPASDALALLPFEAKVAVLEKLVSESADVPDEYRERIKGDLVNYRLVQKLRGEILQKLLLTPASTCLYELADCDDWIVHVSMELDETMRILDHLEEGPWNEGQRRYVPVMTPPSAMV